MGFVKDEDLPYYYTLADALVLPSVYYDCFGGYNAEPEAFGLVLAEAMSCNTPVIASEVGGVPYSKHKQGLACDCWIDGMTVDQVRRISNAAQQCGMQTIEYPAELFVHCEI